MSFRLNTISVREKVAVTLRYLASGDTYRSLELRFLISSKTIQKIVMEVSDAIINILGPIHMRLPSNENEWVKIADYFATLKKLPHCLGALDRKHVNM